MNLQPLGYQPKDLTKSAKGGDVTYLPKKLNLKLLLILDCNGAKGGFGKFLAQTIKPPRYIVENRARV